jgi:hypothetical protein
MTKPPKVGDLLRFDNHSYCIVTKQHRKDITYWDVEWILAIEPKWYLEESTRYKYHMEHFSFDSWVNLSD